MQRGCDEVFALGERLQPNDGWEPEAARQLDPN
jgi:hypothetical protein